MGQRGLVRVKGSRKLGFLAEGGELWEYRPITQTLIVCYKGMASIDFGTGRITEGDDSSGRGRIMDTRNGGANNSAGWSLSPKRVNMTGYQGRDDLNLRKVHPDIPEDLNRRELMKDSPKRWDLLHQFDRTKQQTRDFLRQALQEETEYDPECTFQPQISEMSELLMRKLSRFDFHERNKHWSTRKQVNLEKIKNSNKNKQSIPFEPKSIKVTPKYKTGVVETKQGVKSYLDKIAKQKLLKERDEWLRERKRNKSTTPTKGIKITIPMEQKLSKEKRGGGGLMKKFDENYLQELRGIEHRNFLEGLKNKQEMLHVENMTYDQATDKLHDQLFGLNLEDYASKIKIKRRLY